MATLQKIRNRAGILISIFIGFALLVFVLGDMLSSGGSMFQKKKMEYAKIGGKSIQYSDFHEIREQVENYYSLRFGLTNITEDIAKSINDEAWNRLLISELYADEYKNLGIGVSGSEVSYMLRAENPKPIITQLFRNPQTGKLDIPLLNNIKQLLQQEDNPQKELWLLMEDLIISNQKQAKYNNLVQKGLYATSLQANNYQRESSTTYSFDYISKPFYMVPDSIISIPEKELKKYYKENIDKYQQEESRSIRYVEFEIVPSKEDDAKILQSVIDRKEEFSTYENNAQYLSFYADTIYNSQNFKKDELDSIYADFMFEGEIGDVYGPYFKNNAYYMAKLTAINNLPDSVKARQMMLEPTQVNLQLADSLKNLLLEGRDFAELFRQNAADKRTYFDGEMGWVHENNELNDPPIERVLLDTLFFMPMDSIKVVLTQRGICILQKVDQSRKIKKVQVGIFKKDITYSEKTKTAYFNKAVEFAANNTTYEQFMKAAQDQGMVPRYVSNMEPLQTTVNDLERPRTLVKWAFDAELHEVSEHFLLGDKYVIATVEDIKEKGDAKFEDVKANIEAELRKKYKAEKIKKEIASYKKSAASLQDVADKMNLEVKTISSIRFTERFISGIGTEPALIGNVAALQKDVISDPIIGNNAVYVVTVTEINIPELNTDFSANQNSRKNYERTTYSGRSNMIFETLKEVIGVDETKRRNFH